MLQFLGYASGIFMMISTIPYVRDIVRGNTKPERATWFIWSLLNFIALFSQIAKGATFSTFLTIGDALAVIIVFILSIKYGMGGFKLRDKMALLGVGISLYFWYLTNEPAVALFIVIFIDLIGAYLTLMKSYEHPETETAVAWFIASFAGFLGVLSVGKMNFILLVFPIYICLINFSTGFVVYLGKRRIKKEI